MGEVIPIKPYQIQRARERDPFYHLQQLTVFWLVLFFGMAAVVLTDRK